MRKRLFGTVAVVAVVLLVIGQAADASGSISTGVAPRTSHLSSQFHNARVAFHAETGAVRMLGGSPAHPVATRAQLGRPATATAAASAFLARNATLFGVSAASDLTLSQAQSASSGRTILRYQQTYKGIPVLAGDLVVDVSRANDIISINGEAANDLSLSIRPAVSAAQARSSAIATIAHDHNVAPSRLSASIPHLWVYDARLFGPSGAFGSKLVWRMDVTSGSPIALDELVLVNAQQGGVVLHFDQIESVSPNRIVCDRNNVRGGEETCGTSGQPVVIHPNKSGYAAAESDAQRAFDYSGNTWKFYFNRFGRNSLDGKGLQLKSTVRFCDTFSGDPCPFPNAFWNGTQMFYGNGYASGDDVDGHELTHGFTEFTSHLLYAWESGAINEGMSDIMGEFIDQDFNDSHDNDTPAAKWLVGEDLTDFGPGGLRNMKDPSKNFGTPGPDRMTSPNWYKGTSIFDDQGGVHENSSVANKAAYLLGEDASHAPIAFNGQSIQPLGRDKASALFFEVDGHILTSGSDYADLAAALKQACQNLLGTTPKTINGTPSPTGKFTAANCAQVNKVVLATAMTHRAPNGARASIAACPAARPTRAVLFADNVEYTQAATHAASFPWLLTGGLWFTDGENATSVDKSKAIHDFNGIDFGSTSTDGANIRNGFLTTKNGHQIPAHAYLRFNQWSEFDNGAEYRTPTTDKYDGGRVEYSTDGGATWKDLGPLFDSNGYNGTIFTGRSNPLSGKRAFVGESHGYFASRANLSSLAGKNVKFRWHTASDIVYGDTGWYLDDISIYTCN